jgi:hypothetical protein
MGHAETYPLSPVAEGESFCDCHTMRPLWMVGVVGFEPTVDFRHCIMSTEPATARRHAQTGTSPVHALFTRLP